MKIKTIKIEYIDQYKLDKNNIWNRIYASTDEILNNKLIELENEGNRIINIQCTRKSGSYDEYLVLYEEKENDN